jgi:Domain of unknown function (DUF4149)
VSELQRLRWATLAAGLWWGSLSALCFVVVPLLFTHLPSPAIAGSMAARLFSAQTWLSCGCALLLLMAVSRSESYTLAAWSQTLMRPVVAGLLLALLLELAVAPRILAARAEGQSLRLWHGLGSAMLVLQWFSAGAAFWRLARR